MIKKVYMSLYQIKQLYEAGMVIGSHSVSHKLMSRLTETEFKKEIDEVFKICSMSKTKFALLKCTALYPSKDYQLNLNSIQSMISEYNEEEGSTTLTGYQDITVEMKWKVINE